MTITDLAAELQRVAPGAAVFTGGGVDGYDVGGVRPAAVVRPREVEQVAALLALASRAGLAVTPRGAGTMIDLGNPPRRLDVVLDLSALDRVLEHRPRDLTVTVEAGITLGVLQRTLAEHGQSLALDPPLAERATVGGVLAANAFGPRRQRYGTARDLLIGSRAVLADGTRIHAGGKVVKNVAGYDLNKLMIGSIGTIGVIVEATLKVTPLPPTAAMLIAAFPSFASAHAVAMSVAQGKLQPLTLEIAGPSVARRLTEQTRAATAADAWLLLAEMGGTPAPVERTRQQLVHEATTGGSPKVTTLEPEEYEPLLLRLRDFGRSTVDPSRAILRAAALPSEAPRVVEALGRGGDAAVIVRAGSGLVYGYSDASDDVLRTTVARLRREVGAIGGTIVVERAPLSLLTDVDPWGIEGADVALMRRVKDAYDPAGVLSPGRLV